MVYISSCSNRATGTSQSRIVLFSFDTLWHSPFSIQTIEVIINAPKKCTLQKAIEKLQTIHTQDVFPDFPNDLIISETEPKSLQEDARARATSGTGKVHLILLICMCTMPIVYPVTAKGDLLYHKDTCLEAFEAHMNTAYMRCRVILVSLVKCSIFSLPRFCRL